MNANYDELDQLNQVQIEQGEDDIEIVPDSNAQNDVEGNQNSQNFGVPLPDQDVIDSVKLRTSLMRYKEEFGKYLIVYGDKLDSDKLKDMNQKDLKRLLDEVKVTIACRRTNKWTMTAYLAGMGLVEKIGNRFGLELEGLQLICANSDDMKELITEVSLEYEQMAYLPPWQRLALQSGYTILSLHQENTKKKKIAAITDKIVPEAVKNQFKDL